MEELRDALSTPIEASVEVDILAHVSGQENNQAYCVVTESSDVVFETLDAEIALRHGEALYKAQLDTWVAVVQVGGVFRWYGFAHTVTNVYSLWIDPRDDHNQVCPITPYDWTY